MQIVTFIVGIGNMCVSDNNTVLKQLETGVGEVFLNDNRSFIRLELQKNRIIIYHVVQLDKMNTVLLIDLWVVA